MMVEVVDEVSFKFINTYRITIRTFKIKIILDN